MPAVVADPHRRDLAHDDVAELDLGFSFLEPVRGLEGDDDGRPRLHQRRVGEPGADNGGHGCQPEDESYGRCNSLPGGSGHGLPPPRESPLADAR